jgi:hypothetical protein
MSSLHTSQILQDVSAYYSGKIHAHGPNAQGVDWNGEEGQILRFQQLARLFERSTFSVNDWGCGYGAMLPFLDQNFTDYSYCGIDISPAMIEAASLHFPDRHHIRFLHADVPDQIADYGVASGIFNVRFNHSDEQWRDYILSVLDGLDRTSRSGFAFNVLSSYADADFKRADLFYADPLFLFDHCKRRFSRHVALLHDYGLYEFTILVRKCP